jgi:hypothetical protein
MYFPFVELVGFIERSAKVNNGKPFFLQILNLRIICLSNKKDVEKANKLGFKACIAA